MIFPLVVISLLVVILIAGAVGYKRGEYDGIADLARREHESRKIGIDPECCPMALTLLKYEAAEEE